MINNGKQNYLNKITNNPKQIFLIDALEALLTSILLFVILTQMKQYFGMPSKILYLLSGIVFCLFIYSISCHLFIRTKWKPYLRMIIIFNTIYSILSIGVIFKNYNKITELGMLYFSLELIIIGIIIRVEYLSLRKQKEY